MSFYRLYLPTSSSNKTHHQVSEALFYKAKKKEKRWDVCLDDLLTDLHLSKWNLLTRYLCVGLDGKHIITPRSVSADWNSCWKPIKLLIWMLHLQASPLSFTTSFLLGTPREISDCLNACHPGGELMGSLMWADLSRVRASPSSCTGPQIPWRWEEEEKRLALHPSSAGNGMALCEDMVERDECMCVRTWGRNKCKCAYVCRPWVCVYSPLLSWL